MYSPDQSELDSVKSGLPLSVTLAIVNASYAAAAGEGEAASNCLVAGPVVSGLDESVLTAGRLASEGYTDSLAEPLPDDMKSDLCVSRGARDVVKLFLGSSKARYVI